MKSTQLKASFWGMANLPLMRQLVLLLGLAVSIALAIYIALWFRRLGNFLPVWGASWQLLGGLIAILVLLGVLRPMLRHLAGSTAVNQIAGTAEDKQEQKQVAVPDDEVRHSSRDNDDALNLELVKAMVSQEPKRVAQVVKQWLAES
ncbi:MAG: hypothetical protein P8Z75_11805 [Gammaproteobacteria bacterium]